MVFTFSPVGTGSGPNFLTACTTKSGKSTTCMKNVNGIQHKYECCHKRQKAARKGTKKIKCWQMHCILFWAYDIMDLRSSVPKTKHLPFLGWNLRMSGCQSSVSSYRRNEEYCWTSDSLHKLTEKTGQRCLSLEWSTFAKINSSLMMCDIFCLLHVDCRD